MHDRVEALLQRLSGRVDSNAVLRDADIGPGYRRDATDGEGAPPLLLMRPRDTAQLADMLSACNALGLPVVIQGGRTGLSGGARSLPGEVALSMERMNAVGPVDALAGHVIAEAGAPLETVQQIANAAGFLLGVDIGSRGTATIGGNVACNAGGIRVLRYGMFRAQVLGLEVALADGAVLSSLRGLAKDNSGYDLSQVFVGSEGTLGVVARACLKLHPAPRVEMNALVALPSLDAALALLSRLRARLGLILSAFEIVFPPVYEGAVGVSASRAPLANGAGCYAIIEMQGQDEAHDGAAFEAALMQAMEEGLVDDAILSRSIADMQAIWKLRDDCSEFIFTMDKVAGFDISVPLAGMQTFLDAATARIRSLDPDARFYVFGHLGDGNLHYLVQSDAGAPLARAVYEEVASAGGSISAEHGIGLDKKNWLPLMRTEMEMDAMRRLKRAFDPNLILNRGRIFDMPDLRAGGNR